jgi:hypothetical protein
MLGGERKKEAGSVKMRLGTAALESAPPWQ